MDSSPPRKTPAEKLDRLQEIIDYSFEHKSIGMDVLQFSAAPVEPETYPGPKTSLMMAGWGVNHIASAMKSYNQGHDSGNYTFLAAYLGTVEMDYYLPDHSVRGNHKESQ